MEYGVWSEVRVRVHGVYLSCVETVLLLLRRSNHLAQLILLGELTGESAQIFDEIIASCDDSVLGGDFAVGLDTELELGNQRVRDLVPSEQHVRALQQTRTEQVA